MKEYLFSFSLARYSTVMSSSNKNSKIAFIIDKEVPPFYGTKSCHKRIFILSYCTYSPCGKTATKENILVQCTHCKEV